MGAGNAIANYLQDLLGLKMSAKSDSKSPLLSPSTLSRSERPLRDAPRAVILAIGISLLAAVAYAQQSTAEFTTGPFGNLAGTWSGGGTITMKDGGNERVRCSGTYTVGSDGKTMHNELRCSSDSYKVEMTTDITQIGDQLAGNWTENTRHVAGHVSGRATPTSIHARAEGDTFTALLAVTTHGDRQSISIQSPGSEVSDVSLSMTRESR
jgi:hypothetical protein